MAEQNITFLITMDQTSDQITMLGFSVVTPSVLTVQDKHYLS